MQRNIRPHTNTPQSLSLRSLPQPNCAEDTSYLTSLPSPDIIPHKCLRKLHTKTDTHMHTCTHTHTHAHTRTPFSSSCSVALSGHVPRPAAVEGAAARCVAGFAAFYSPEKVQTDPGSPEWPCRTEATTHLAAHLSPRIWETGFLGSGLPVQLLFPTRIISFINMPPHDLLPVPDPQHSSPKCCFWLFSLQPPPPPRPPPQDTHTHTHTHRCHPPQHQVRLVGQKAIGGIMILARVLHKSTRLCSQNKLYIYLYIYIQDCLRKLEYCDKVLYFL